MKSYALHRMVTFPMTLTDPNPVFKVKAFLKSIISKTVVPYGQSFYRTLIGNHTQSIEWYHFQWPWVNFDPDFKVTTFLKPNIGKTARLKDKVILFHTNW